MLHRNLWFLASSSSSFSDDHDGLSEVANLKEDLKGDEDFESDMLQTNVHQKLTFKFDVTSTFG